MYVAILNQLLSVLTTILICEVIIILVIQEPENPELHLIVGAMYCHIVTQKTCGNKHTYVAQAFALLAKYCQVFDY